MGREMKKGGRSREGGEFGQTRPTKKGEEVEKEFRGRKKEGCA